MGEKLFIQHYTDDFQSMRSFNGLVSPSFDQRKKTETNYLHSYLSKQCNWCPCPLPACRQAKFSDLDFLTGNVLFYDKMLFLESSSILTALSQKLCMGGP